MIEERGPVPDSPEELFDPNGSMIAGRPVALLGLSAGAAIPVAVERLLDRREIPYRIIPVRSSGHLTFFGSHAVAAGERPVIEALERRYPSTRCVAPAPPDEEPTQVSA